MMSNDEMKELFFSKTPPIVKEQFTPEYYNILDEAIENIQKGKSTIDGKPPTTDNETFYLIAYGFLAGIEAFEGLKKAIKNSILDKNEELTLNINYRGQKFSYSYNNKEDIKKEIQDLEKLKSECKVEVNKKKDAENFYKEIKTFIDDLEKNFKHIRYNVPETDSRSKARYNFKNGLQNLKIYSESKLKQKDDHYFFDGKNLIVSGLDDLIFQLEEKLKH